MLKNDPSKRLKNKICILIRDLLFYDNRLHLSFNDISTFSNTNNIKMTDEQLKKKKDKNGLSYDVNKEFETKNEL